MSLVSKASQNGDAIGGRLPNRSTIHDKSIFRLMTKAIRSPGLFRWPAIGESSRNDQNRKGKCGHLGRCDRSYENPRPSKGGWDGARAFRFSNHEKY